MLQRLNSITPEQLELIDSDFERLLDAISDKNETVVAEVVQRWKVPGDGIVAKIILRLLGEKEVVG